MTTGSVEYAPPTLNNEEAFRRRLSHQKRSTTKEQRPFYLRSTWILKKYRKNPCLRLGSYNYKVESHVGPPAKLLQPVVRVIDTGAGPNLIANRLLSEELSNKIRNDQELVDLVDANGKPLQLIGTISLSTKVGKYQAMLKFVLSRQFSTDVILGCDFLDQHTDWIGTRSKTLILKDDSEVPIFRRPVSKMSIEQPEKENINPKRERKLFSNMRIARRISLAPWRKQLYWHAEGMQVHFSGTRAVTL